MYDELYAAWQMETERNELGHLPSDFYTRATEYLLRIKEESKMLEPKTLKANLLEHELANASRMAQELIEVRYRKILKLSVSGRKVPLEGLTLEEAKLRNEITPSTESYSKYAAGLLEGQAFNAPKQVAVQQKEPARNRVVVRFLKPVPTIVGVDMKSYGPFVVEDVASVPSENARVLIKQGYAKAVDTQ